jgi:hypothetical protein
LGTTRFGRSFVVYRRQSAYAWNREHLSWMDLNPVFQEINQRYFDGQLSGVRVEWSYLDQESGEARKLGEREYEID